MDKDCMLTTADNPFNPFNDFASWYNHDIRSGVNSAGQLARIAKCSNALSDELNDIEIERAIDSLVDMAPTFYIKIFKDTADKTIKEANDKYYESLLKFNEEDN